MSSRDVVTPSDLGRKLGVSPKTIRAYLRERYGKLNPPGRWDLTDDQVAEVEARFGER